MSELFKHSLFNDASLISYYRLEDLTDSKGANTLTNNGSVPFNLAKFQNGADFGSSNTTQWLSVLSNFGIDGSTMSLSCWIKINANPSSGVTYTLPFQASAASKVAQYIRYVNTAGVFTLDFVRDKLGVADAVLSKTGDLGTSLYHHCVYTYDGVNIVGYLDTASVGSIAASGSGSNGSTVNIFSIGGYNYNNANPPTTLPSCIVDDVAVFSRVLTAAEILSLYNSYNLNKNLRPAIFKPGIGR